MEATLGLSLYSCLYLKLAKMLSFLLSHIFSSTKMEKRAEQVLPGSRGMEGRRGKGGRRGGRNGPKNVCTYE
jgi:hypothetical protein